MQKKDTYTREEVIEMLTEMQKETAHTNGFFAGHVTQLWVIRTMLGKRIAELGGEGIQVTIVQMEFEFGGRIHEIYNRGYRKQLYGDLGIT